MAINWRIVMNKTRYKIATLTGSAVMAAMLLSLLILNIVFNKKINPPFESCVAAPKDASYKHG